MAKKIAKIIFVFIGFVLLLLIALPWVFKERIVERVKYEINERLDARVEFGRFGLSMIRHFPNVAVWVNDFRVIGEGDFAGDTLADIGRTRIAVDLRALLGGGSYEIKSIRLDNPKLLFRLLEDGSANWNIVPVDDLMVDTEMDESDTVDAISDFKLVLKRVDIRGGNVSYHDDKYVTYIDAKNINAVLRGDLTASITTIGTREATIGSFSLRVGEWPVLSRVAARLTAEMDADLDRFVFTFRDNLIHLNELPLTFEGMVGWPEDDLEMDFRFSAARSDFASFLSLVPALYTKDFETLTTSGNMRLEGHVTGAFTSDVYPGFGLHLGIDNGMFRYPGLPASVERVNIAANIQNPGVDLDLTIVDVPLFQMSVAGAPIEARFHLARPLSDPSFDSWLYGKLDLSQVAQFYPLGEGITLRGSVACDLEMRGSLSAFEQADLTAFYAGGGLVASGIYVVTPMLENAIEIGTARLNFEPQELTLDAFTLQLGESNISANGNILNLPGYLFSDQLLQGHFTTHSTFFDFNTLMDAVPGSARADATGRDPATSATPGDPDAPEDTTGQPSPEEPIRPPALSEADGSSDVQMGVIKVPGNIDFTLQTHFDKVVFGKMQINNVNGIIQVIDEQVHLENLRMNMLGGSLALRGMYDAREQKPYVNLGLDISSFDIQDAFQTFNTAKILAPIGEFARGAFSVNLQLSSLLDDRLQPVLTSLRGQGKLNSSAVMLQNTPSMVSLANQLHMEQLKELSIKDILLSFSFSEGKLELPPVDFNMGQIGASLAGVTYFDQQINYVMRLNIPREMFGGRANQVLDDLVSKASVAGLQIRPGDQVTLDVLIKGRFLSPEVSFSMASVRSSLEDQLRSEADRLLQDAERRLRDEAQQARDRVEDAVQQQIDETRETISAQLEARIAQVMEEANRQATLLRTQAKEAADRVRTEAAGQAARLEREAQGSGALAQAAARQGAQQVLREAERRATQIEAEGERSAQRVLDEAQRQADRLRQGE